MSNWSVEFKKLDGVGKDTYLQEFLEQAESSINGLQLEENIDNFVKNLDYWDGYNNYYSGSKFITRGGYMNIDELRMIHENSNHSIFDAYKDTRDSVYRVYKNDSNDLYPVIPFVLFPIEFSRIREDSEMKLDYKLEKEGRSRLSGVLKARRKGEYKQNNVPVLFAIRRSRN